MISEASTEDSLRIPIDPGLPLYKPVGLFSRAEHEGRKEPVVVLWLLLFLVFVPSGVVTKMLGWTGTPVVVGGVEFHIAIFLPMIFCALCTIWFGFLWGAIPAYLASLLAATTSGMPASWALVYAFATPLSLAVFTLAYRALPVRTDLRSVTAFVYYAFVSFISAIICSTGSFIFVYAADIEIVRLYGTWQSWWAGTFLTFMLVNGPLLILLTPQIVAWKEHLVLGTEARDTLSKSSLALAFSVSMAAIFGYIFVIHEFSMLNVDRELEIIENPLLHRDVLSAMDGHHLIHWVLGVVLAMTCVFWYQVVIKWTASLRESAHELSTMNSKLQAEITERQSAKERIRENAVALEQSITSKDRFFSIISHDLRSPMGSILSVSSFLTEHFEDHDPDTFRELLGVVHTSAEKMYSLLENLLEWSRLQAGGLKCEPEEIDLRELVEAVTGLVGRQAVVKGVDLKNTVPPGTRVMADINMIRSVLINLLTNAIKYTETADVVEVASSREGSRCAVHLRDSGVGMTRTQITRLFRIDEASSTRGTANEPGAGLGLIICQELIALHGDRIEVDSTPGKGTTLSFRLDAVDNETSDERREEDREVDRAPVARTDQGSSPDTIRATSS